MSILQCMLSISQTNEWIVSSCLNAQGSQGAKVRGCYGVSPAALFLMSWNPTNLRILTPFIVVGRRGACGERECFKATQGFWGMPRGGVPTKDVPSGDTR